MGAECGPLVVVDLESMGDIDAEPGGRVGWVLTNRHTRCRTEMIDTIPHIIPHHTVLCHTTDCHATHFINVYSLITTIVQDTTHGTYSTSTNIVLHFLARTWHDDS